MEECRDCGETRRGVEIASRYFLCWKCWDAIKASANRATAQLIGER